MPTNVGSVKLDTTVLDRITRDLDVNTSEALQSIAFQVEAEAKPLSPYDTGALRSSLHTEKKGKNLYWVADGVEYGIYQELGTYKMAAHPFMVPAVEKVIRFIHTKWGGLFK